MLVSGGMENDCRAHLREEMPHAHLVPHVRHNELQFAGRDSIREVAGHFKLHIEGRRLSLIEGDHLLHVAAQHLPHDLLPDGAGSARDQHHLSFQERAHLLPFQEDRVTTEQILDFQVTQLVHLERAAHPYVRRRDRQDMQAHLHALVDHHPLLVRRYIRHSQHQRVHIVSLHRLKGESLLHREDRHSIHHLTGLGEVIVHEIRNLETHRIVARQDILRHAT